MIVKELNEIKDTYQCLNKKTKNEDFEKLWEISITDKYTVEEKNNLIEDFAKVFWLLCINYEYDNLQFKYVNELSNFIDFINSSSFTKKDEFYENKETVFISFLHELLHRKERLNPKATRFMDFYNRIVDVLERIKWIFSLENIDGEKIFPIKSLIEDVATTFKLDQEHYLQLVFSLEIFNSIDNEISDQEEIKQKMLDISKEYNIELIRLLCEGGKVLFDGNASINSTLNGTIVVKNKDKVLIRNIYKNYFEIDDKYLKEYDGNRGYEGKNVDDPIAYYYEYYINNEEELVNLKDILCKYTNQSRINVIKKILKEENYNVFLGECFWVNQNTKHFSRILNPFGINDQEIIINKVNTRSGNNKFDKFIYVMTNDYEEYGVSTIVKRGTIDVLTLDFIILYYKELVHEGNDFIDRMIEQSANDGDYYQNILLKIFLKDAFEKGTIFKALKKYYLFIRKYYIYDEINENTEFAKHNKLIMPYCPYIPCSGNINEFYALLAENEYIKNTEVKKININKNGRFRKKYFIDEIEIPLKNILDMNLVQIEENEIHDGYCLFDCNEKIVYILKENNSIESMLNKIREISNSGIISIDWEKYHDRFSDIQKICMNIGFSDYWKNFGRKISSHNEDINFNISLYKLLWHIQYWEFDEERYKKFVDLILNHYYTDFVLQSELYVNKFFDELMNDSDAGKLIIAKESDGEGSTLKELFDRYNNGMRGSLRKAFDGGQIRANITNRKGKYYYLKNEIKDIVFITDNILSAKSTIEMLKFYLENKKSPSDKRTYLWEESDIIPDILKSNFPINIELKTILCTKRGKDKITDVFEEYNIKVFSQLKIADNVYNWTKEVEDIIIELYEIKPNSLRRDTIQCIFRPCNMPSENILPRSVKDISKLIGLFQRKTEI